MNKIILNLQIDTHPDYLKHIYSVGEITRRSRRSSPCVIYVFSVLLNHHRRYFHQYNPKNTFDFRDIGEGPSQLNVNIKLIVHRDIIIKSRGEH